MARIVLISPDGILSQAIQLFLFPIHEVQAIVDIGIVDAKTLDENDLLIVDGSSPGNNQRPSPELVRSIQRSKSPTLWLEEEDSPCPVKRENLLSVKKPLQRELFQEVLNVLLSGKTAGKRQIGSLKGESPDGQKSLGKKTKGEGQARKRNPKPIDLVEVVEEENSPQQKGNKSE